MRSERANLASRDSAAVLHFANDFLHPGDCGSREGVAIELHIQFAASRVADGDGFGSLRGASFQSRVMSARSAGGGGGGAPSDVADMRTDAVRADSHMTAPRRV